MVVDTKQIIEIVVFHFEFWKRICDLIKFILYYIDNRLC